MAKYLVQFEITEYVEEAIEDADGEVTYEERADTWESSDIVEADSEDEAREKTLAAESSYYDEFFVYSVEKVED